MEIIHLIIYIMKKVKLTLIILFIGNIINSTAFGQDNLRNTISLNGIWQIAEGSKDIVPINFNHTVQVPGLVSLAKPEFKDVGPIVKNRGSILQSDTLREAFWYRRQFTIDETIPDVALLKISKAKYGTQVFLNGIDLGEHLPCFTPGYFDAKKALKKGVNELIVSVGSSRNSVPLSIPDGFDFEKERYIPGIYDNVELILSGTPHINWVQTIPDIINETLQVQLSVSNISKDTVSNLEFTIREVKSNKTVGRLKDNIKISQNGEEDIFLVKIPIDDCHLWTPEDPFLYTLEVKTTADEYSTRFGMREFHFDPLTKKAVLNGKPYFMRGSNVTLYRFFEDSACQNLPWDTNWVRDLHKSFKQFHWNSLRYCIGLAPDEWYKIADEEGFIIQNEFPIWYGGIGWNVWPEELKAGELIKEFTEWMKEDWNHPSVAIWDASNENVCNNGRTEEVGEAVLKVRNLDLSNRPWDNSYSKYRAPGDVYESHPYHFQDPNFELKDISNLDGIPMGNQYKNNESFPVIINEYGWLWLNRDGSPTTLTMKLYENLLGKNSTIEQRRHLYAMYTAAETEFWRCHRHAAAVLHFTALGYSRNNGQTSDHFVNVKKLQYENEFLKYVPDAFSPVGLMLDEWGTEIKTGEPHVFNIISINDLAQTWSGTIHLQIIKDEKVVCEKSSKLMIPSYGQKKVSISCNTPNEPGQYTVIAFLEKKGEKSIKSTRELVFR